LTRSFQDCLVVPLDKGLEIEIAPHCGCGVLNAHILIPTAQKLPIAQYPVGQSKRRIVEDHNIYVITT